MNKMKLTKVLWLEIAIWLIKCKSHYMLLVEWGGRGLVDSRLELRLIWDSEASWFANEKNFFFDETKFPAPGHSADYNPSSIFYHCSQSFGKHGTVNRFLRDQSCVKGWTRLEKFGSFSSITVGIVLFGLGECITGVAMKKTKSYIEKPKFSQKDDQYMLMWSLQMQGYYDLLHLETYLKILSQLNFWNVS